MQCVSDACQCQANTHGVGLCAGDQSLQDRAKAQLDAARFLLQSTDAGQKITGENYRNSRQTAKGRRMQHHDTQQVAVGARAVAKMGAPSSAAPGLVLKCASLGLWAEARDVYEFAVEAEAAEASDSGTQGGAPQARIQAEICELMRKAS